MKRRTFFGSAFALLAATATSRSLLAAVGDALGPIKEDIPSVSKLGKAVTLPRSDVETFRRSMRGVVLTRGDEGYDTARKVWNGAFDRRPALIARCTGAADVAAALNFGRAHELLIAVRGGGHSLSGQSVCEGGLMIDLSPMRGIRVDPAGRTARAESGVLLGEFDQETQAFGLATTAGTVSHTGIAGLTLGGGFGRLGRKYGLAIDNLRAVDIVTPDGKLLQANAQTNPDLFWGVRGGGGNFGVVTSFEYNLHQLGPMVYGGRLFYPLPLARDMLRFYSDYLQGMPDELYVETVLLNPPDGQKVLMFDICHCGTAANAERDLQPLRTFRKPLQDTVGPARYVDLQRTNDETARAGPGVYSKGGFMKGIDPTLADKAIELIGSATVAPAVIFFIGLGGGAVGRVKVDATAFPYRDSDQNLMVQAIWMNPAQAEGHIAWARSAWKEMEPYTKGFYSNVVGDSTAGQIRDNYGPNLARLVALKRKYDPANLLHLNANIAPDV